MIFRNFVQGFFLLFGSSLYATYVDNVAAIHFFDGNFLFSSKVWCLKVEGFYDDIYKFRYKEKFTTFASNKTDIELVARGGLLALNIFNYVDFYGMVGVSSIHMDKLVYGKEKFFWSGGMRATVFHYKNFACGLDGRYFRNIHDINYFVLNGALAPVVTHFAFKYEEVQGAFVVCYKVDNFIPYAGVSFTYSEIEPVPQDGLLKLSGDGGYVDFHAKILENCRKWGAVIGFSIFAKNKFNINLEARFLAQQALAASFGIRF